MRLQRHDIEGLQEIFETRFAIEISDDQAKEYGYWLIDMVKFMFPEEYREIYK